MNAAIVPLLGKFFYKKQSLPDWWKNYAQKISKHDKNKP